MSKCIWDSYRVVNVLSHIFTNIISYIIRRWYHAPRQGEGKPLTFSR